MFQLSQIPLEQLNLKKGLSIPKAGAIATFEGLVRNHNEGKDVVTLEYEAFEELAVKEANKIFEEAQAKFDVIELKCVHRVGKLSIGETAVWVGVSAEHRECAFQACRYIIDEVKHRVPIWKKEYYQNGTSGWVNCQCVPLPSHSKSDHHEKIAIGDNLNDFPSFRKLYNFLKGKISSPQTWSEAEKNYYARQILLSEINRKGQKKLKKAKVLVIGAGGLGSAVLQYLASAGVGTLGVCEFDTLEVHNLHRQPLYEYTDISQEKSKLAQKRIKTLNPFIDIHTHAEQLTEKNVKTIIAGYDLLVDCTDNFKTKFLLNDVAVLKKKPLIQASIYQFEGQIKCYNPLHKTACLRCLWNEIPPQECVENCAQAGVLGVIPGIMGSLQAWETLKFILDLPDQLKNEILLLDLRNYTLTRIKQRRNPSCPVCGITPSVTSIKEKDHKGGLNLKQSSTNVDVNIFDIPPENFVEYTLVDIREKEERKKNPIAPKYCEHLPFTQIEKQKSKLDVNQKYLFFCGRGFRSHRLAESLQKEGFAKAFSVQKGVFAVSKYLNLYAPKKYRYAQKG